MHGRWPAWEGKPALVTGFKLGSRPRATLVNLTSMVRKEETMFITVLDKWCGNNTPHAAHTYPFGTGSASCGGWPA